MAKDIEEKVAVLWDRSEDNKKFQEDTREAHDSLMKAILKLQSDVESLPNKLNENYVTRQEFKAVKAVFTSVTALVSVLLGIFSYLRN